MSFPIYDYRKDLRNVVITPEIRCRFMKLEPGEMGANHTHDLGHEAFLVLQGQAEFNFGGDKQVLGPGQMCFAYADQPHEVTAVGDEPTILYLSVSPHLEPTHTWWDEEGNKRSPRYGVTTTPGETCTPDKPTPTLADKHVAASKALAEVAAESAEAQMISAEKLKKAIAAGDEAAAKAAYDTMWCHIYTTCKSFSAMQSAWNDLAGRAPQPEWVSKPRDEHNDPAADHRPSRVTGGR